MPGASRGGLRAHGAYFPVATRWRGVVGYARRVLSGGIRWRQCLGIGMCGCNGRAARYRPCLPSSSRGRASPGNGRGKAGAWCAGGGTAGRRRARRCSRLACRLIAWRVCVSARRAMLAPKSTTSWRTRGGELGVKAGALATALSHRSSPQVPMAPATHTAPHVEGLSPETRGTLSGRPLRALAIGSIPGNPGNAPLPSGALYHAPARVGR